MSNGDRKGPEGMGPMSGRGRGLCAGNPVPGYGVAGRSIGGGRANRGQHASCTRPGTGFSRYMQAAEPTGDVDEARWLSNRADLLERELAHIRERLTEITTEG